MTVRVRRIARTSHWEALLRQWSVTPFLFVAVGTSQSERMETSDRTTMFGPSLLAAADNDYRAGSEDSV